MQRPGHILRRLTLRHVPRLAGDRAAHRVQSRAEPGRALQGDPVVRRASPVQLPVGQPADQPPAGEIIEGSVDLGQADVISPGQRAAPGQPPARFAVHERGRHAVGQHGRGLGRRARYHYVGVTQRRRSLAGRRGRLRGDRTITSGGASGHSACRDRAVISRPITTVADAVMYQPLISAIWAWGQRNSVTAPARLSAPRSPNVECACSASNDNLPSVVLGHSADGHGLLHTPIDIHHR